MHHNVVIGLTGGIASGKSTAARYLEDQGARIIDADRLGHRAYEPDTPAHCRIVEAFGAQVVGEGGRIDRRALGRQVFGQPDALKRLTDIVWPEIRRLAEEEIAVEQGKNPNQMVVLEAAVLLEAGWKDVVQEIWVIVADRASAIRRAVYRDGADEATIERRIGAQLSNEERLRWADVVIENSSDEITFKHELDVQWRALMVRGAKGSYRPDPS